MSSWVRIPLKLRFDLLVHLFPYLIFFFFIILIELFFSNFFKPKKQNLTKLKFITPTSPKSSKITQRKPSSNPTKKIKLKSKIGKEKAHLTGKLLQQSKNQN